MGTCSGLVLPLQKMYQMTPQHPLMGLSQPLGHLLMPRGQTACFKARFLPAQLHADCHCSINSYVSTKLVRNRNSRARAAIQDSRKHAVLGLERDM